VPHHLLENTPEESPIVLLALSHMFHGSLEPPQKVSLAEVRGLEDPAGLTINDGLQIALYTHTCVRQAVPLVTDPGSKLLTPPTPVWVSVF
jgi:hypothetical protein